VTEAAKTVQNITGLHVIGQTAVVEGGVIAAYRADGKIAFVVKEV
jgi:flavin-binding protein dodecin